MRHKPQDWYYCFSCNKAFQPNEALVQNFQNLGLKLPHHTTCGNLAIFLRDLPLLLLKEIWAKNTKNQPLRAYLLFFIGRNKLGVRSRQRQESK